MSGRRKPCRNCGGPKEPGQQHYCAACDNDEVRAKRNKAIKKRNKDKAQALRVAEREGLPLAERKRVWHRDIPEGLGWCSHCKKLKAAEQFLTQKGSTTGRSGRYCKRCRSLKSHAGRIKRRYGLTPAEYEDLLGRQGGRCAICRNKPGSKRLAVDHDHKCCASDISCGACVRGLLCSKCNQQILGQARDSVETLQRAIDYLISPPAQRSPKMATQRDLQEQRAVDAAAAERDERVQECRDAASHRLDAERHWAEHVANCPLGDECEAVR